MHACASGRDGRSLRGFSKRGPGSLFSSKGTMARWDEDKEAFIRNLIQVNLRAGVEPELVDLLAAYARICLQQGGEVTFYSEDGDPPRAGRRPSGPSLRPTRIWPPGP